MSYENEAHVAQQLEAAGLILEDGLQVGRASPVRCRVTGERGKKGWYWLSDFPLDDGAVLITGAFGVWHGNDKGKTDIAMPEKVCRGCGAIMKRTKKKCPECGSCELADRRLSREQQIQIRRRNAERAKAAAAERKREQAKAAKEAQRKWAALERDGKSEYLTRKQVDAFGVRFGENGTLAVPVMDTGGRLHGLQIIYDKSNPDHAGHIKRMGGSDKRFWPAGLAISGNFHLIGSPKPGEAILIAEGYATGASLHMATSLAVMVVFNANNILPVLREVVRYYPRNKFLICADDDYLCRCGAIVEGGSDTDAGIRRCNHQVPVADNWDKHPAERRLIDCQHCGKPHGKSNTGVTVAMNAAFEIPDVQWIVPEFTDRTDPKSGKPRKISDFNDLHVEESLQAVASQVREAIAAKFPADGRSGRGEPRPRGAGERKSPKYMAIDRAVERYSLIYGVKDTMFDHEMFKLVPKSCVMDVTPDRSWGDIKRHPMLRVFDIDEVGFDPGGQDENIKCNIYAGWPTQPDSRGKCDKLLELLQYLCSNDDNSRNVYQWVLKWLAYPIQNPGAKMKTALVVHGGSGVGKNMFFESIMSIYGKYGKIVGQDALEDTFNDWQSGKLFLLANEVVARQELFHAKNRLKGVITDDDIRIRAPFMGSRWERNHMNIVFLSNESMPVVIDPDDRRFSVIWTPKKKDKKFYRSVLKEIADGGIAALHHYLLNLEIGDFDPGTLPVETKARESLIELSKESPDRFIEAWLRRELDVPCQACALGDLFKVYEAWCRSEGERFSYAKNKFSSRIGMHDDIDIARKPVAQDSGNPKPVVVVLPAGDEPDGTWSNWLKRQIEGFNNARLKQSEREEF